MSANMRTTCLLLALLPLAGCALLTKAEPLDPVYLSPEADEAQADASPVASRATGLLLRLRRVEGADNLGLDLVIRTHPHRYHRDEDRKWTQPPVDYLRQALATELFQRRGITRAVGGDVPELEVTLLAFEDSRAPAPTARIRLTYRLLQGDRALLERTLAVSVPVPGELDDEDRPARLAAAMGEALRQVVDQLAGQIQRALEHARAKPS